MFLWYFQFSWIDLYSYPFCCFLYFYMCSLKKDFNNNEVSYLILNLPKVLLLLFSHVQLFVTPWAIAHQASLTFSICQSSLNSCPLSQWYHPTISSSVIPFSSCFQSFPASGSLLMSRFISGGRSIGVSGSASVLPMNIQDWFPLGLTGLISKGLFAFQRTLKSLLQNHSSQH